MDGAWKTIHIDYAINYVGSNWLILIGAHSKYLYIHSTTSICKKPTIFIFEYNFAHFGYPHTIFTDDAIAFTSE